MQEINQYLSLTLKRMRKERGWSLDKTSNQTGVSKAMLGQIERGESSPTIAVLWKIATGFNTSLSLFLEPPAPELDKLEIRDPAYLAIPESNEIQVATLFPYNRQLGFEILELTLQAGYRRISEPHEPGVSENIIVTKGKLDLWFDDKWHAVNTGQAARFAADHEHGYRNSGSGATTFLDIISYQR